MFLFFLSLICFHLIDNYYSSTGVIRFDNFGFDRGGHFNITISSNKKVDLTLFLANQTEYSSLRVYPYLYQTFCLNKTIMLSEINITSPKGINDFTWSGIIKSTEVYTPILLNCFSNKSLITYHIELHFRNPFTFLDFRDKGISSNDTTMSLIYCLYSLIWFIIFLYERSLTINICYMLSILPPLKAISLALTAATYESLSYKDDVSDLLFYSKLVISTIHLLFFSFFVGLACDGYGVIFEKIRIVSLTNYGFASFGFSLSSSMINIVDNPDIILYLVFTSLIFGFYYFNLLSQSLSTAFQIQRCTNSLIVLQKSSHVVYFALSVILCLIILFVFQCFSIVKEMEHSLSDGIEELIEFSIYVFIAFFFIPRKSFYGNESQEMTSIHADAFFLSEPSQNEIVFIQKSIK